jgi:hypothetical protein
MSEYYKIANKLYGIPIKNFTGEVLYQWPQQLFTWHHRHQRIRKHKKVYCISRHFKYWHYLFWTLLYPHHKMWGWGYNGFALSCLSVRPSPLSCPLYLYQFKDFLQTWLKCSPQQGRCAEPMLPMCQLKVKVTIEGQISNNQILDSMSCPLCKSFSNGMIFFNLGSNVHFNKVMCRTHVTILPA